VSKPLLQFLAGIATDPEKLGEFLRNPDEVMHEAGLSQEDIVAIKSRNASALEVRLVNGSAPQPNSWAAECPQPGPAPPPAGYWPGPATMAPPATWPGYPAGMGSPAVVVLICPPSTNAPQPAGSAFPATYSPMFPATYSASQPGVGFPATYLANSHTPTMPATYLAYPQPYPATYYPINQPAAVGASSAVLGSGRFATYVMHPTTTR
jgi:hypothetical protein